MSEAEVYMSSSVMDDDDSTTSAMDTADDSTPKKIDEQATGMTTEEEDNDSTPMPDDDETASENDDSVKPEVEAVPVNEPAPAKPPPKMRIKLSLTKKPKLKLPMAKPVASSDAVEAVSVASSKKPKLFQKSLPISRSATGTGSRRRPVVPSKMVKLPPIMSPGFTKSSTIFETTMKATGYTWERRTEDPHRGSSVTRTVGDLFDSDVHLSLRRIQLAPPGFFTESEIFHLAEKKTTKEAKSKESDSSKPEKKGVSALPSNGASVQKASQDQSVQEDGKGGSTSSTLDSKVKVEPQDRDMKETVSPEPKRVPSAQETCNRQPLDQKTKASPPSEPTDTQIKKHEMNGVSASEKVDKVCLAEVLLKKLGPVCERPRKRKRLVTFRDMAPVSLTLPYPESYIQRRLCYLKEVQKREQAIIDYQEAQMHLDLDEDDDAKPNPVKIPPIPDPPKPPTIEEMKLEGNFDYLNSPNSSQHPIIVPNSVSHLVGHLDKNCFHISQGRYFALQTNTIADPAFVGPTASGSTTSYSGGGLATATTSTTTSTSGLNGGGMTMILSVGFHSAAAIPATKDTKNEKPKKVKNPPTQEKKEESPGQSRPDMLTTTTTSSVPLRSIMENEQTDQEIKDSFRDHILRAMVYTIRSNKSPDTFKGPNGKTYDLGKAFAMYSGIKPCQRCKGNKQGVYHCRIKRKHNEPDHDGGNSIEALTALSKVPLESLLRGDDATATK